MARAIRTANHKIPEGFEGEMSNFGLSSETEIRGVNLPPFHEIDDGHRDVIKGAIAGAVAGLVAGWVMVEFQKVWSKASEAAQQRSSTSKNLDEHNVPEHRAMKPQEEQQRQPDDATVK